MARKRNPEHKPNTNKKAKYSFIQHTLTPPRCAPFTQYPQTIITIHSLPTPSAILTTPPTTLPPPPPPPPPTPFPPTPHPTPQSQLLSLFTLYSLLFTLYSFFVNG